MIMMVWSPISAWAENERPSFNQSRYKEDYRFLKTPTKRTDLFDPIKSLLKLLDSLEELFEMVWSKSIILVPPGSMLIMILDGRIELVRLSSGVT